MPRLPIPLLLAAALALSAALPAAAQNRHAPETPPRLEIEGAIAGGTGGRLVLSPDDLARFPPVTIETALGYFEGQGPQRLSGVDALAVIDAAGPEGETFLLTALDGYELDAPRALFEARRGVLVTELNGAPLDPETFGPFWIAFDLDAIEDPDERAEYEAISVYALDRITVLAGE